MKIGVMVNNLEPDRLQAFAVAKQLGFEVVHASALPETWLEGPQRQQYVDAVRGSGVIVETMFVGFDGQSYADIPTIRRTVGLAIAGLREHRVEIATRYSELAAELGVPALATHLGFLPSATDADYHRLVTAVRQLVGFCAARGQSFNLETGQESSSRLLHFITAVGHANLGVNFDPANFLLYGTDEPLQAFETLLPHIRGVHCKDGTRSPSSEALGEERPLGQGEVNFPALLERLRHTAYRGTLIIERETGTSRREDILAARVFLQAHLGEPGASLRLT